MWDIALFKACFVARHFTVKLPRWPMLHVWLIKINTKYNQCISKHCFATERKDLLKNITVFLEST